MDGIREVTGCETVVDVLRLAEDRSVWRSVVAFVNLDTALQQGNMRVHVGGESHLVRNGLQVIFLLY